VRMSQITPGEEGDAHWGEIVRGEVGEEPHPGAGPIRSFRLKRQHEPGETLVSS
jgi:hypothetical protein